MAGSNPVRHKDGESMTLDDKIVTKLGFGESLYWLLIDETNGNQRKVIDGNQSIEELRQGLNKARHELILWRDQAS
jgi:hypothetical protein